MQPLKTLICSAVSKFWGFDHDCEYALLFSFDRQQLEGGVISEDADNALCGEIRPGLLSAVVVAATF